MGTPNPTTALRSLAWKWGLSLSAKHMFVTATALGGST